MTVPLGNPFALGATGVPISARTDRLVMGAHFVPAASAFAATAGFLVGPNGTQGELSLLSNTLLRVAPFIAVVQGTHNTLQGQYVVPNTTQRDLAVTARDASLFRRALIVVRVADSLEAGVTSSATTDGAWLEIVPGPLAASNPALPPTPANAVLAGELTIPSVASGQPVTVTSYSPRAALRGQVYPVPTATAREAITTTGAGYPGLEVLELDTAYHYLCVPTATPGAFAWRLLDGPTPVLRAGLARTDGNAVINANAITDLMLTAVTTTGTWNLWTGPSSVGRSSALPGRYRASGLMVDNIASANRWNQLLITGTLGGTAGAPLGSDNQGAGFGGSGGSRIIDAPAGLQIGARYQNGGGAAAGTILGGTFLEVTWEKSLV